MSKPVAAFSYKLNTDGLSVDFTDRSSGIPTSWSWDFGFSPDGTSTSQNPTGIVFPAAGTYIIKLIATNADGSSDPYQFEILAGEGELGISIVQLVLMDAPTGFTPDFNYLMARIRYWQQYLAPSVPLEGEDVYNESKWPDLYNVTIAKLVIWELIVSGGGKTLIGVGGAQSGGTGKGQVKRVETGPSNAEWYDMGNFWDKVTSNPGGSLPDLIKEDICMFAARIGIYLPICPMPKEPILFNISHPTLKIVEIWPPSVGKPITVTWPPENQTIIDDMDWEQAQW